MQQKFTGMLFALVSFTIWSLYAVMWKALQAHGAEPLEILAHRIVWAHAFCWLILLARRGYKAPGAWPDTFSGWALLMFNGVLNMSNWLICIWAATSGHVVEASFGYFLAPLMAAALGMVAFRERLSTLQRLAIAIASATVLVAFATSGHMPWIALAAGGTAAGYAALRKHIAIPSVTGTVVETALLVPCAVYFLLEEGVHHHAVFTSGTCAATLCVGAGFMTAMALLSYASATHRLRLATLGVMQYVYPCGQLLLGIYLFHEPFTKSSAWTFAGIVTAITLYSGSSLQQLWAQLRALPSRKLRSMPGRS